MYGACLYRKKESTFRPFFWAGTLTRKRGFYYRAERAPIMMTASSAALETNDKTMKEMP